MISDEELIESLLYEEEGGELDTKRDQYPFTKASDDDKSELLKDILAFSNSWRRTDAFILIGVQEVKGGRSKVIGISELLDDARVQQFVNSKTNRPVLFSYRNLLFENKHIAVIQIPVQQRPIYIKKDFGRVRGEAVYIRRGSSTAIASIDEISKMGLQSPFEPGTPDLRVYLAEPKTRTILGDREDITSLVLDVPKASDIPDYVEPKRPSFLASLSRANSSYYRELVRYTRISRLVTPLYFAIANSGSITAHDVRIEMKIDKCGGNVIMLDMDKFPSLLSSEYDSFYSPRIDRVVVPRDVLVTDIGSYWIVEATAGKVQPKATFWFYVQPTLAV